MTNRRTTHKMVPRIPSNIQLRALIKWRGYDPDGQMDGLDFLSALDVETMGTFIQAYKVMVEAAE